MISPEAAWQLLQSFARPVSTEVVLRQSCVGRVLAEPLKATVDVPAHDVSAMDGFAVCGPLPSSKSLSVTGTIAAGDRPGQKVHTDEAMAIMTGAPVPTGADRVVPVEVTEREGDCVRLLAEGVHGQHIRRRGEIQQQGDSLLDQGRSLSLGCLGLLASHGVESVEVYKRPSVRLVVTGDEVVPPDVEPEPGQLRDAHTDFLVSAVGTLGLDLEPIGIVRDDREALRTALLMGLQADVLLITGGVSMGEFDFVAELLANNGCEVLFDKVAVQPGKPLVAAQHAEGMVFGLPGNPASVMASFWLFVRPFLRSLLGEVDGFWKGAIRATLTAPLPASKGRDRFFACEVGFKDGEVTATPSLPKGSHDVLAYASGTALVRVPANSKAAKPGQACQVLPLADWRFSSRTTL